MAELAAADLAFTHDESAAFLNDIMGLELSAEHIAELDTATEGWIAGLQLAALSMRNRDDLAGFIASFSGRHRGVFDFLAEEVLAHQPPDVRDFLLETSILDSLAGPLCDAVTGRSDGQAMLEELERANLFIIALDDERRWFRYHHLFADFLRGRLAAEAPTRARERHLRASRWHEAHGHVPEAIGHALAAPDPELGARLIERESPDAWSRGEIPTVLRWLEALPIEVTRHRPRLFLQHALALALTGRPDDAEACVSAAEEAGGQGSDGQFLEGFAAAVRSWCARLRGDARTAIDLARRALALLPAEAGGLRAFAAVCLGDALWTTGDLSAARDALADAAAIGRDAGHVYATISAMTLLARVHAERGHLHAARETLDAAQQLVTQQNAELLPAAGGVHIGVGALQYEHDRLDEAERALRTGIDLAEGTRNVTDLVWGTVVLSRARWARGDTETATALAREAARTAGLYGADLELAIAAAWLTRLHVSQGDLASADAFAMERAATAEGAATAARVLDRIAAARLLHARGRHHEALRLLDGPRRDAEANGRTRDLIEILSLRALVQWATQQRERALSTLTRALALAEPEGYVRVFVDEGQPMATLLSALLRAGRAPGTPLVQHTACARRLLAAMGRAPSPAGAPSATLPAPLTERELDILGMIAAGLTNREIAARTFVSLGTVKTHINNLYRKLGVRSRTQALARARELRLLAP
jgi:LuxR family maltose regulon positive regulatory protein